MEILLFTILTTLVSDVYFQGNETVKLRKDTKNISKFCRGHLKHTLQIGLPLFFVISILFNQYIGLNDILKYVGIITITHIIIDIAKCTLGKKIKEQYAFLIDQVIHLVINIWICTNWGFASTNVFPYINKDVLYGGLVFVIIYIYTVRCGEFFIDIFMNESFKDIVLINEKVNEVENSELMIAATEAGDIEVGVDEVINKENRVLSTTGNDTGRYIGILERSIVLFLVVSNNYSSIALLLTGKSIARSKEFEDKEFAVKFIVGTFLSIFIGILGGEAFKVIIKYFI